MICRKCKEDIKSRWVAKGIKLCCIKDCKKLVNVKRMTCKECSRKLNICEVCGQNLNWNQ